MENLDRLKQLRALLSQHKIDVLLIRSTDQWLNEYVPENLSRRIYATGFTGSTGDALVTQKEAILFVDGRYALQATQECPSWDVRVVTLGKSISSEWLQEIASLSKNGARVAIEYDRIPVSLMESIRTKCVTSPVSAEPIWQTFGPTIQEQSSLIWSVSPEYTGQSTNERLADAASFFKTHNLDAILISPLDEIAWLSNWRSNEFPFQAVFSSRALVFPTEAWIAVKAEHLAQTSPSEGVRWIAESEWDQRVTSHFKNQSARIGFDPQLTSEAVRHHLESSGAELVSVQSPFQIAKSVKNPRELAHMRSGFVRADHAVHNTEKWVQSQLAQNHIVTEYDVSQKIQSEFEKSGTRGLSFRPICAAAKNGAVIHYGTPDKKNPLKSGELFLLDTGGFYEASYATDLTRTFLLGDAKAQPFQTQMFTLVLKSAIAGMSARFPKGTTGAQLDAISRDPIWRTGQNFEHGTGHGVGINVHESPPRISSADHTALQIGHVFSIEPGLYVPGVGGVRIENICTVIEDPQNPKFLCVLPLSFAPLDKRLINMEMLTGQEKEFLRYYDRCFELDEGIFPPLPPYPS